MLFARLRWCVQESLPPMNAGQPAVAVTLTVVLFVSVPLVPVTVILNVPAGTLHASAMVSVDVAGDGGRVTLVGLKVRVTPGTVELVRATVPENGPIAVTVIVDVPDVPVATEDEVAAMLKPTFCGLTVIVFDVPALPA